MLSHKQRLQVEQIVQRLQEHPHSRVDLELLRAILGDFKFAEFRAAWADASRETMPLLLAARDTAIEPPDVYAYRQSLDIYMRQYKSMNSRLPKLKEKAATLASIIRAHEEFFSEGPPKIWEMYDALPDAAKEWCEPEPRKRRDNNPPRIRRDPPFAAALPNVPLPSVAAGIEVLTALLNEE